MKNTSEYVVQTLIDDEDMSADLASLYPAASKIGDAAAAFIDKADQTIEKKGLMGTPAGTVAKCIDICQNVVKEGAAGPLTVKIRKGKRNLDARAFERRFPVQQYADCYRIQPKALSEIVSQVGEPALRGCVKTGAASLVVE